jgi:hypothetical protein
MQAQHLHSYFTILLAIWALIGPLVGIALAHLLSKNWQRRQWELDNVKDETRELLRAFNALIPAYTVWVRQGRRPVAAMIDQPEQWDRVLNDYTERTVAFHCALRDRLFIARDVKRLEIKKKWDIAMKHYEQTYNDAGLEQEVDAISAGIASIANH